MSKTLEQVIRGMWHRRSEEQIFENFQATEEDIANLRRIVYDALQHRRRCEIQLKIIDNT